MLNVAVVVVVNQLLLLLLHFCRVNLESMFDYQETEKKCKMEVTKENFLEALPLIEAAIGEAEFIAIDAEFTGLGCSLPAKVLYDTPAERYIRQKKGLSSHIIIQYGICTFKWNTASKLYEAKPFNIYIFPRARKGKEVYFQCQSSSLKFLASQGFDFNKLIYKGLSYMSPSDESKMRENMEKYHTTNEVQKTPKTKQLTEDVILKSPVYVPESMKDFIEDICSQVKVLLENKDETTLDLPKATAFKRKLTFEVIEERFPSKLHLESVASEKGDKHIRITKADEETRLKLKAAQDAEKMAEFETAVGFLKVARLLSESKKLLLGHNMLLDLMLTIGQFFVPLPDSLEEFKEMVQTLFPKLMDTKLLATTNPLKAKVNSSVLGDLYQCVGENFKDPVITFADGFKQYENSPEKFHEAGYDAYCTGVCFAKMADHLCKMQHPTEEREPIDQDADLLRAFLNRIYVMRINDLLYINMDGVDVIPERRNVFHLTFPPSWRYPDINKLFDEFGGVYTSFLNESSALVALDREENIDAVIQKMIVNKDCGPCKVITYAQHVGIDSLDKYEQAETNDVRNQKDDNEKEAHKDNEGDEQEAAKPQKKRKRKRVLDQSLEDGEVSSSPEQSLDGEEDVAAIKVKKIKKEEKVPKKPVTTKDFYEPDDW